MPTDENNHATHLRKSTTIETETVTDKQRPNEYYRIFITFV